MRAEALAKVEANGGWQTVMISNVRKETNRRHIGKRMDEGGRDLRQGKDP